MEVEQEPQFLQDNQSSKLLMLKEKTPFKVGVVVVWIVVHLLLSFLVEGVVFNAIVLGVMSLSLPTLAIFSLASYVLIWLSVPAVLLRVVVPSWKKAILVNLLAFLVMLPVTYFVMPILRIPLTEMRVRSLRQEADIEMNKYLNTVTISKVTDELQTATTKSWRGREIEENALVISFDLETPHQGDYEFYLHAALSKEEDIFESACLSGYKGNCIGAYLEPGKHHLTFTARSTVIKDRKLSGPYRLKLFINLKNEELERLMEENWTILSFTLFDQDNFYTTQAYDWQDFFTRQVPVGILSHQVEEELSGYEVGWVDLEVEIFEAGTYHIQADLILSLEGNPEAFDFVVFDEVELGAEEQHWIIPITVSDVVGTVVSGDDLAKAQEVLVAGYSLQLRRVNICGTSGLGNCVEVDF